MLTSLTHGPLLWFLNRGTGITLLVVLSLSMALGMLTSGRTAGGLLPVFVTQTLHRNLSLLGLSLVVLHAVTAIVDSYVDIRWWQALLPWGATYKPFWLELGTVAFDVMLLVALTTSVRRFLSPSRWHRIHLIGYVCWPIAFVHGAGIGTDARTSWARWIAFGCVVMVSGALTVRLARRRGSRTGALVSLAAKEV